MLFLSPACWFLFACDLRGVSTSGAGRSLQAQDEPTYAEKLTQGQISARSGVADLVRMSVACMTSRLCA